MKTLNMALVVGFLIAQPAFATDHLIRAELFSYPSHAAGHLANIQRELADKAIEVCGGRAAVASLRTLRIQINGGTGEAVATLSNSGSGLDLFYPKLSARAVVSCRD